jgi:hypothetical protein
MKRNNFVFKTHIDFGIKSDVIEPDVITKELNISPSRFYKKGDVFTSKYSPRIGYRQWNIWTIDSKWTILEEETVSHHIEYLKSVLFPKINILKRYKEDKRFELSFWIWIETDNAGIGLDLLEDEISFMNSIANRIHFSLIINDNIE